MIVIRVAAILVISMVLAEDAAAWQQSILEAQPEAFQRQLVKEGRSGSERMHSRAPVMNKARESQFGRTRAFSIRWTPSD